MRSRLDLPSNMGRQRIRVSGDSPAGKRRREQAKRRSWCCCSAMLVVCLVIAIFAFRGLIGRALSREADPEPVQAAFPLELETKQSAYLRYAAERRRARNVFKTLQLSLLGIASLLALILWLVKPNFTRRFLR